MEYHKWKVNNTYSFQLEMMASLVEMACKSEKRISRINTCYIFQCLHKQ